ncbi:sigma-70 family RNA polymerase sigma factor [Planomicrobium sp. Y74]|uniref:sigma-70 family RNA polymerase sigma factor n=1 Tax=Planomicrobium sp. Y74 TaxID=2478977 RepID=UPI000EF51A03|nr:sigma-70 family RNA polymerase sigma factor [Planomicrobium sp. Y74]RLQ92741.1 sigma-70 family RNA polymerase sigma factor [Planomicrobium sp. Y74]
MNKDNLQTSSTLSIEEELLTKEKRYKLLRLMSELGVLDRDVLVMKFIQGNTDKEIASKTGLVQGTVEDRVYQALRKLSLT